MFESPADNAKVGFLTRIELEKNSCKRERVKVFESIDIMEGIGRKDVGD